MVALKDLKMAYDQCRVDYRGASEWKNVETGWE
jgi:hypothetical protein